MPCLYDCTEINLMKLPKDGMGVGGRRRKSKYLGRSILLQIDESTNSTE